jgi:hypothetical protein
MHMRVTLEEGWPRDQALRELLRAEPYLPYANFAPFTGRPERLLDLHLHRFGAAVGGVLVARDMENRPLAAHFLENETQASTVQTINVFGKLGHHCLRSTAAFHMRLDGVSTSRQAVAREEGSKT